jgi:hypothetical protein
MIHLVRSALLTSLLAFVAGPAWALAGHSPSLYVKQKTRDAAPARKVLIVIAQTRLEPGIDSLELGVADLVDLGERAIDKGLIARGRKQIAPVVAALGAYDFDTPIRQAMVRIVAGIPWMHAQDIEFTRDGSNANIEAKLNESNTRQMLVLDAHYTTDHRYTSIIVSIQATLLTRQIPKGHYSDVRLKREFIPFQQVVRSVIELPGKDLDRREPNLEQWAADQARLVRTALDIGVKQTPVLLEKNLSGGNREVSAWRRRRGRPTVTRSYMLGWEVGRQDAGTLFVEARAGTLNYLQKL